MKFKWINPNLPLVLLTGGIFVLQILNNSILVSQIITGVSFLITTYLYLLIATRFEDGNVFKTIYRGFRNK